MKWNGWKLNKKDIKMGQLMEIACVVVI